MEERFPAIKVVWWINSRSFTAGLVSATKTIIPSYKLNVNILIFFFLGHAITHLISLSIGASNNIQPFLTSVAQDASRKT